MKLRTYSSLAAFLAHYAALRAETAGTAGENHLSPHDAATLNEMHRIIDELGPASRDALHEQAPDSILSGAAARHRIRAELKLHRLLDARGILAG